MLGMYVFAKSNIWRCELSACLSVKFFFKKKGQSSRKKYPHMWILIRPSVYRRESIIFLSLNPSIY